MKPHAIFHAPGHDHGPCEAAAIAEAEAVCAARGARLTPLRRQVLEALLAGHRPVGAYEIMERLAETGPRPAPITVYRALDFLLAQGLAHRLASRTAFIACIRNHAEGDTVVFLICDQCGAVGEAPSAAIKASLNEAAAQAGFAPRIPVIEVTGLCGHCRAAASGESAPA